MKTHRLLLAGFVLAFISGTAQAQSTPEAIIGQTPGFPPAATLAAAKNGNDQPAAYQVINSFVEKIETLRKQNEQDGGGISAESREKVQAQVMANSEKLFKQMTGKSISELENLSEAEQQAVIEEITEQYLSSMGIAGVSLDGMLNSREEKQEKMDKIVVSNTGLTLAELEAISRLDSKEKVEAYLKQDDRMQHLQNSPVGKAAAKNAQANKSQTPQASESDMNIMRQASEEQERFTQQMNSIAGLHKKEHDALAGQFAGIRNKYYGTADYQKANGIVDACNSGNITYTPEQCKAATEQQNAMHTTCDTECFALWRNQIIKEQGRIKAMLAEAKRVDALQSEAAKAHAQLLGNSLPGITQSLSDITQEMPDKGRNAKAVVNAYLNVTLNIKDYPEPDTHH
jgi:hypothetical protein